MGNKVTGQRADNGHAQSRFDLSAKTPTEYLLTAVCKGDPAGVAEAVARGATVDWRASGAYGGTPLHAAAMKGNAEIIKMLVDAGAAIDVKERVSSPSGAPTRRRCAPLGAAISFISS